MKRVQNLWDCVERESARRRIPRMNVANPISVTVADARRLSGLGNTKLWQLIANGQLTTVRVGRRRLILYASLLELLGCKTEELAKGRTPGRRVRAGSAS
jgi:hypothetical protein